MVSLYFWSNFCCCNLRVARFRLLFFLRSCSSRSHENFFLISSKKGTTAFRSFFNGLELNRSIPGCLAWDKISNVFIVVVSASGVIPKASNVSGVVVVILDRWWSWYEVKVTVAYWWLVVVSRSNCRKAKPLRSAGPFIQHQLLIQTN